jgi:SAM-dependent methyltransferase
MIRSSFSPRVLLSVASLFLSANLYAQTQAGTKAFEPQVGQSGKDVVWVPTPQALVDTMLDLAKVTPQDYVIDLGSGDGRTVITAAKRGAKAHGIEYEPDMVALSQKNAAAEGIAARATFAKADLFATDFSSATVITMFLLPSINMQLRPKLLDMKPGTRVVSNTFTMEDWEADQTVTIPDCDRWCTALFWIVPAKVEGVWRLAQGELDLTQRFQNVTGMLRSGASNTRALSNGKLRGDQIAFTVGASQYTGKVNGDLMEGTVMTGGASSSWRATRASR